MAKRPVDDDDDELEEAVSKKKATKLSDREQAGGEKLPRISTQGKEYTFGGEPVNPADPSKMYCAIVDFSYLRVYYGEKYNKKKPKPPICFALSVDGKAMKPHENSSEPQSRTCAKCPQNQPGSGGNSDFGRACQERRRIAVIHPDDLKTTKLVKAAVMPILEPSVMSLKFWGGYLKKLKENQLEANEVLTRFYFDSDQTYPLVKYALKKPLDEAIAAAVAAKADEARELVMTPFNTVGGELEEDEPVKKKKKRVVDEEDDEDDEPAPKRKKKVVVDEEDDDEEDDDDDDDEEPAPRRKKKVVKKKVVVDDDDDDDDEDDDDDDEDDEDDDDDDENDDEPAPRRKKKVVKKKVVDDEEDDDDEADEEDDEDDEPPVKKKRSRFG